MNEEQDLTTTNQDDVAEVPRDEWPDWCTKATTEYGGREVALRQADRALGEVHLAKGQPLVAIEHDEFGKTEAVTIKCGSRAVPVSYVVAEPRSIRQHLDRAGGIRGFSIIDATGRLTALRFA